jgi:hypothetical protein
MVENKKYSIYKASRQLAISNSTAKLIIKNYREQGRIFRKKDEQIQPKIPQETPPVLAVQEAPILKEDPTVTVSVKLESPEG